MIVTNTTAQELTNAFNSVNKQYKNNLRMQTEVVNAKGTRHKLRLFVKDSKKEGARRGFSGRRMINACWHVHGDMFDAILEIQPKAVVRASNTPAIYKDNAGNVQNNWQDRNIGSMIQPMYFSEACEC